MGVGSREENQTLKRLQNMNPHTMVFFALFGECRWALLTVELVTIYIFHEEHYPGANK